MFFDKLKMFLGAFFIIAVLNVNHAYSQFTTKYNLGLGILTTQILGDNNAKRPIVAMTEADESITGGSFGDWQSGIQLRATFPIDENEIWRFPLSIDYSIYKGRERLNLNRNIVDYFRHDVNLLGISPGIQFIFADIRKAQAKLYIGIEARFNYYHNISVEFYREFLPPGLVDTTYILDAKEPAFRIGGNFTLGVEGKLRDQFYVNAGGSIGSPNFLGRKDDRGELLTPLTYLEPKENLLWTLQVFILIQYNM